MRFNVYGSLVQRVLTAEDRRVRDARQRAQRTPPYQAGHALAVHEWHGLVRVPMQHEARQCVRVAPVVGGGLAVSIATWIQPTTCTTGARIVDFGTGSVNSEYVYVSIADTSCHVKAGWGTTGAEYTYTRWRRRPKTVNLILSTNNETSE